MSERDVIGQRIVAAIVDLLVVGVVFLVIAAAAGGTKTQGGSFSANLSGGPAAIFFVLAFVYWWACETVWGQTLGKRLAGVRVVGVDGGRAGAGAVFVRTLLRAIDGLPFFYLLGFIVAMATGSRRQRLGDLLGRTRVVAAR